VHAQELSHLLEALAVVAGVADLGGQWLAGGLVLHRYAQVNQAVSG
jgi:hypothetical protein